MNSNITTLNRRLVRLEQREYKTRRLRSLGSNYLVAADLECDVVSNPVHTPVIAGYCDGDLRVLQFTGPNCVQRMFDEIVYQARMKGFEGATGLWVNDFLKTYFLRKLLCFFVKVATIMYQ